MVNFQEKANFIWQVADDILRGPFKQHEYGDVILPFVVLRRLDCVLEKHKDKVVETYKKFKKDLKDEQLKPILMKSAGNLRFYNISDYDLRRLRQDAKNIELNFRNYMNGYSDNVREILDNFQMPKIVANLVKNGRLFNIVDKFTEIDLHPDMVKNHEMGYIFEEILRRFSELSNEAAGQHYTPREVIRLMVNLIFDEHKGELKGKGIIRSVFDPACGTGGMLTTAKDHILKEINSDAQIRMFGQEINPQTYAIAKSDMLIMGEDADNIREGSSFSEDRFVGQRFDYMLCNPPFGQSWKSEQEFITKEAENPYGRFSAGTPRVSDGALLFLQHMISKMEKAGRIAIIFNGSPLFTGDAGSGESDIRKWIIGNDWLEAVVALPTELFYNTGIATYIWVVTNRKTKKRQGSVQLINAVDFYEKMRKSLGNKRCYISDEQIKEITKIYSRFQNEEHSKVFNNNDFGYMKVTVERPLIEKGKVVKDKNGDPKPDTSLRDYEKVPLKDDVDAYFEREVRPHVPDAWMDRSKDKVGYELNFTKYFYEYRPLRSLKDIKRDILALEAETEGMLKEILE
jgi:type I restriction enzyme M protein